MKEPFFVRHKEPFLVSEMVPRRARAALEAEKVFLCISGELDEILTKHPRADQREQAIFRLLKPRLEARFKSGVTEFDVQIQEGLIGLIFRHDDRVGGGPAPPPWARVSIPLRLCFDDPYPTGTP